MDRCILYTGIRLLLLNYPFIFHFSFSPIFEPEFFLSHFFSRTVRPTRLKLVTHVKRWWMYRVYWNHSAALIRPFMFSFFFLSSFQPLQIFVTLFSGTVRPRKLKLGTHVGSGKMYRIYRNHAAAAYSSLYFFIFLSHQFSNIEIFRQFSLRNCEA